MQSYKNQVDNLIISNVDLSKRDDGIYNGSYGAIFVEAEVNVFVKDHKIINIELIKHRNGKWTSAEIITSKVIEEQKLKVDIISGATSSSKVILKSIENALNKSN